MSDNDCLFCQIAAGEIPADIVYEDEHVLAFRDINPQASLHALVIPRKHISTINDIEQDDVGTVGRLFPAAAAIARSEGVADDGYRVVMNCNEQAGQTVFHVHLHVLGGRRMNWPPG
jgi:histidine triad (HIT) family protein